MPPTMGLPSSLFAILSLFALTTLVTAEKDNAATCDCFRTNSSTQFFTNHIFRDYRNISGVAKKVPDSIADPDDAAAAPETSSYFLSKNWTDLWQTQNWNNSATMDDNSATVLMVNSLSNVYLERSKDDDPAYNTFLTLRTLRLPDYQSAAEIDTSEANYQYLSLRVRARVIGSPGACAGIFTYLANDNPQKVQEADIEILTHGPRNVVQYTNQPADSQSGHPIAKATRNATNPGNQDWTLWNTYRYDWTPEMSAWYVNGESVANISFQAPRDPTTVIFNMWSDGAPWSGNMSVYEEAYLQIQWVQMVYNTSGPYAGAGNKRDLVGEQGSLGVERRKTKGCALVCSVDDKVESLGTPAFLYNGTGSGVSRIMGEGVGSLGWLPLLLVGAALVMGL